MEESPSSESNLFSASQEIYLSLWNPKIRYRVLQESATSPYPESNQSTPCPPTQLSEDPSCTKGSVQARGTYIHFITRSIVRVRICYHLAQPPSWRITPCRLPRLLIQYVRSYPPYWRSFLHPQPEDVTGTNLSWGGILYTFKFFRSILV